MRLWAAASRTTVAMVAVLETSSANSLDSSLEEASNMARLVVTQVVDRVALLDSWVVC